LVSDVEGIENNPLLSVVEPIDVFNQNIVTPGIAFDSLLFSEISATFPLIWEMLIYDIAIPNRTNNNLFMIII
jgi:hypothetical protein